MRAAPRRLLVLAVAGLLIVPGTARATAPYAPLAGPLRTPWTSSVSSTLPLPEYPRPQLERSQWENLNGQWQYEPGRPGQRPPFARALAQTVLVPFPVQAPLSGIGRGDVRGWYRRTFRIPAAWRSQNVLLNVGAVSWSASVYVNGRLAGRHRGDYDAFSLDITRLLRRRGPNELIFGYWNPLGTAGEPVGKQIPGAPYSFYHTASSGIWQTVWLEPVAPVHVNALALTPDVGHGRLVVTPTVTGGTAAVQVLAAAYAGPRQVATASAPAGRPLILSLAAPRRLWSPDNPFLYTLHVQLHVRGRPVDRLSSYFGMRQVSVGRVGGVMRILLNGRFVFQSGALDQLMWPDGLYTAPTDAALRSDLVAARQLGFNMLRVHQVVEPERFYLWADRLGVLLWQDMPSSALRSPLARRPAGHAEYLRELDALLAGRRNHPSIVGWVPFNEGWNWFDPAAITSRVHRTDPTRLVDTDSGSANSGDVPETPSSDVRDTHLYFGPFSVPPDRRASVIGEFGGALPVSPAADLWPAIPTSVGSPVAIWSRAVVASVVRAQFEDLHQEMLTGGVSASVFTELTATEQELGLISYDRLLVLLPAGMIRRLNGAIISASERLSSVKAPPRRPPSRPPPPAPPPGALATWRFDEGAGTSASANSGDPLTLEGGASWTRGVHGHALRIDAGGQAAASGGPLVDTTHSFTLGAWVATGLPRQTASAISEGGSAGSVFSLGLVTATPAGRPERTWWAFEVPRAPGCSLAACAVQASQHYGDGRYAPGVGRWHYLAGVYDAPAQTLTLYVDGLAQDVEHAGPLPAATGPLEVGAGAMNPAAPDTFVGAIDELTIYARALSPAEVWRLDVASRAR